MSERVVVLFGGTSGERRVSVASAQHVRAVMPSWAFWYVAPDGAVFPVDGAVLAAHEKVFEQDFAPNTTARFANIEAAIAALGTEDPVFFLGFHGGSGEDGTVQALLEARGLAFTGSGSGASHAAFDKAIARSTVAKAGVRTAMGAPLVAASRKEQHAQMAELLKEHGRIVAKPIADGSSVGLFHVRSEQDIEGVLLGIEQRKVPYLLEGFVTGPELTVGVVQSEDGSVRALPASEVRLDPGRVFDFEGKYLGHGTIELTPAEVPEAVSKAARALAVQAHLALGCEGYSRTDVIASEKGPVFLETNTLPGLTRASFLPQQLAVEGTSMKDFLHGQLLLARIRQRSKR